MTKKKDNFDKLIQKYDKKQALPANVSNVLKKLVFDKYSLLQKEQFFEALRLCSKGVALEIAIEAAGGEPQIIESYQAFLKFAPKDSPNVIQFRLLNATYKMALANLLASVYDCATACSDERTAMQAAKIILELEEKVKDRYAKTAEKEVTL